VLFSRERFVVVAICLGGDAEELSEAGWGSHGWREEEEARRSGRRGEGRKGGGEEGRLERAILSMREKLLTGMQVGVGEIGCESLGSCRRKESRSDAGRWGRRGVDWSRAQRLQDSVELTTTPLLPQPHLSTSTLLFHAHDDTVFL